jgi:hypothetical protein
MASQGDAGPESRPKQAKNTLFINALQETQKRARSDHFFAIFSWQTEIIGQEIPDFI